MSAGKTKIDREYLMLTVDIICWSSSTISIGIQWREKKTEGKSLEMHDHCKSYNHRFIWKVNLKNSMQIQNK